MKRIDNTTAVSNMFTDGNPAVGLPATTVPAEWLNGIQEEIATLIERAGITPNVSDNNQLRKAIETLLSTGRYGVTTNTSNAYVLNTTPNPSFDALRVGMIFTVQFNAANTGAATLNVNGTGNKAIVSSDGTALDSGKISANAVYLIVYDGTNFRIISQTSSTAKKVIHVREEQASGTSPSGNVLSTGFNTRVLNTVVKNTISGASLASNRVFLPEGEYSAIGFATARSGSTATPSSHKILLKDITNSIYKVNGLDRRCVQTATSIIQVDIATLNGFFSVPAGGVNIELQHYTNTNQGIGEPVSSGQTEVYADLIIEKVA